MFITRREYESMSDEIARLREKYEDLRFKLRISAQEKESHHLEKYEYAVLLPKGEHCLQVWNNGRFEQGVKNVELSQNVYEVPYFKMVK